MVGGYLKAHRGIGLQLFEYARSRRKTAKPLPCVDLPTYFSVFT